MAPSPVSPVVRSTVWSWLQHCAGSLGRAGRRLSYCGPVPTAEDIEQVLGRGHEMRGFELKGPGLSTDKQLFAKVVKASLSLGNLRDGGHVIIGIDDTRQHEMLPGLNADELGCPGTRPQGPWRRRAYSIRGPRRPSGPGTSRGRDSSPVQQASLPRRTGVPSGVSP